MTISIITILINAVTLVALVVTQVKLRRTNRLLNQLQERNEMLDMQYNAGGIFSSKK